jgi:hypothetical protein
MAKQTSEDGATCDTRRRSGSCRQAEEESHSEEELRAKLSRIGRQLGGCTIPEWLQRWALG